MKHLLASSALALVAATSTASAQSAYPDGFTPYGSISISAFGSTGGGDSTAFGSADLGFGWDFGGNFGVDYSLRALSIEDNDVSAHYLALAYNFGNMRVSAGVPRAAYDRYGDFRVSRTLPLYEYFLLTTLESTVVLADIEGDGIQSYGLRLDGASNTGLQYAVSVHGIDGLSDAWAISSSARFTMASDIVLTGGVDYFESEGDSYNKAKLGIAKDFGRFDAALNLAYSDFGSNNQTLYELSGSYDVTEQFNVGLGVLGDDQSSDLLVTADASYRFWQGASAFASLSDATSGSDSALYAIGLRYDF